MLAVMFVVLGRMPLGATVRVQRGHGGAGGPEVDSDQGPCGDVRGASHALRVYATPRAPLELTGDQGSGGGYKVASRALGGDPNGARSREPS